MNETQLLTDFLIWLGTKKRGLMSMQQMPSGDVRFGPSLHRAEDLIAEFQEAH